MFLDRYKGGTYSFVLPLSEGHGRAAMCRYLPHRSSPLPLFSSVLLFSLFHVLAHLVFVSFCFCHILVLFCFVRFSFLLGFFSLFFSPPFVCTTLCFVLFFVSVAISFFFSTTAFSLVFIQSVNFLPFFSLDFYFSMFFFFFGFILCARYLSFLYFALLSCLFCT